MGSRPRIALIAALDREGVIGRKDRLPWHLPADLAHFRRLTLDHAILMGRRTWESLPGPLPRRRAIVLTRNRRYEATSCTVVHSLPDALARLEHEERAFVIGGASLYEAMMPRADRMYLTRVATRVPDGDAYFPPWDPAEWRVIARTPRPPDRANPFPLTFLTLVRRTA